MRRWLWLHREAPPEGVGTLARKVLAMTDQLMALAVALLLVSIAARLWCMWQVFREPEPNLHNWGAWPPFRLPASRGEG